MRRIALLLALAVAGLTHAQPTERPFQDHDLQTVRGLAEGGEAKAQAELAYRFLRSDERLAVFWAEKAASQGDAGAKVLLGAAYAEGAAGLQKDMKKAFDLFRSAAGQGSSIAEALMARALIEGGTPGEAVALLTNAANSGDAYAQAMLGDAYLRGLHGLRPDPKSALLWLRASADQDHPMGQVGMAKLYAEGVAVPRDAERSFWYALRAAKRGHRGAQKTVGDHYLSGSGVPQDIVEAHRWFNLSAASGSESARHARDAVATRLTPEQLERATELARSFKPRAMEPIGGRDDAPSGGAPKRMIVVLSAVAGAILVLVLVGRRRGRTSAASRE